MNVECNYLRKVEYCYGNDATTEADVLSCATSSSSNQNVIAYDTYEYSYDSAGRLNEVKNVKSDISLRYEWDVYRVSKVSEYASDILGQELEITYGTGYTKVKSSGNDEVLNTGDDILTYYTLDKYGRAVSMYSCSVDGREIFGGVSGVYDTKEESKNSITERTVLGHVRDNLLLNGDFNYPSSDLSAIPYWSSSRMPLISAGNSVEEPEKLFLTLMPTRISPAYVSQQVSLKAGEYTFSLQHETANCGHIMGKIEFTESSSGTLLHSYAFDLNDSATVKRHMVVTSFLLDTDTDVNVKISFETVGSASGTVTLRIGKTKLEYADNASDYNIISEGGFDSGVGEGAKWTAYSQDARVDTDVNGNKYLVVPADGSSNLVKQQIFHLVANELQSYDSTSATGNNEARFIISGYAKADRYMPQGEFRIYAEICYYNGSGSSTTVRYPVEFSGLSDEWQYASATFSLNKNAEGEDLPQYLCIKYVYIVCDYSDQLFGCAYFDDISLTYVGLDKSENTVYEDGLVVRTDDGIYRTYYEYDENRNVKRVADNNGILVDYYYKVDANTGRPTNLVDHTVEYEYTYLGSTLTYPYYEDNPDAHIVKTPKIRTDYTYNSYGMLTEILTYATSTGNPYTSEEVFTRHTYTYETTSGSKIFGALLSEKSADNECKYFYDSSNGWLLATLSEGGHYGYSYVYDESGKLLRVDPALYDSTSGYTVDTSLTRVEYEYDGADRLSVISTYSTDYTLNYDVFGNSDSVKVGERELASYEYNENNGKLKRIVYGNGYEVEYVYNEREELVSVRYKVDAGAEYVTAYEYKYASDGQILTVIDNVNEITTSYRYDAYGRLVGIGEYSSLDSEQIIYTAIGYDDKSRVESMDNCISYSYLLGGVTVEDTDSIEYLYYYADDGRLEGYTVSGDFTVNATLNYDALDRVSSVVYTNSVDENSLNISESYLYNDNMTDGASGLVKKYTSTVGADSDSYTYTYNGNGYIKNVRYDDGKSIKYTYNDLGWLIEEDNAITYKIYTYVYDSAGNIIRVTETEKTPNDDLIQMGVVDDGTASTYALLPLLPDLPSVTTYNYSYTDSEWGDLLTKYNGVDITYDEIGNPLSYYNGSSYTFTWDGRRLVTAVKGTDTMSFAYDSDGLRISKTVNGVTTYYVYDGELLVAEYTDTTAIVYIYDANDSPIGFKCRESTYAEDVWDVYWYGKNLQGDIAVIYNSAGTKLVSYTYTAWGNTTKTYHNGGASTIAAYNNLTYRGYYYDTDLGMYYLQTRYYDAEIGRFINADSALYNSVIGYNMFAYCYNNPIYYIDVTGEVAEANKDNDDNYLNDFMFEGGARGNAGGTNMGGYSGNGSSPIGSNTPSANSYGSSGSSAKGSSSGYYGTSGTKSNIVNDVCFVEGTLVKTESGDTTIENIRIGDKVYAYDEETGETALKTVVNTFVNETTALVHIFICGDEIVCTNEHPFYSPVKGWISAYKLRAGDILISLNGEHVVVEKVQHEILENPIKVYNFEVEDFHTYYVGTGAGVLVHNTCVGNNSRGVGGKGWVGDKTWRGNVATVRNGGTITSLNGGVPTASQAKQLIYESGGTFLRIDIAHEFPNPHNYAHINYTTKSGISGTIKILD